MARFGLANANLQMTFFSLGTMVPASSMSLSCANYGKAVPFYLEKPVENAVLYRNFGWNELASLKATGGKFTIHPSQFQGKQFWVGESGLNMWTNSTFSKPFTARVSIPKSFVTPGNKDYIFLESDMMIDTFPGGTVLPSNLERFNAAQTIEWIRY
jgi:hypothetical protein